MGGKAGQKSQNGMRGRKGRFSLSKSETKRGTGTLFYNSPSMVAHTFNPSIPEAGTGTSL